MVPVFLGQLHGAVPFGHVLIGDKQQLLGLEMLFVEVHRFLCSAVHGQEKRDFQSCAHHFVSF
ncbi:hypothetical protein D3C81_2319900 [compost metagenome]